MGKKKDSPPRMKLYPEVGVASKKLTKRYKTDEEFYHDIPPWARPFVPLIYIIGISLFTGGSVAIMGATIPLGLLQGLFLEISIKYGYNIRLSIKLDEKIKDHKKIMKSLEKFKLYKMFIDTIPEENIKVYLEDDEKTISIYIDMTRKLSREKLKHNQHLIKKIAEADYWGEDYYSELRNRRRVVGNPDDAERRKTLIRDIKSFFKKFKTIDIGGQKYKIMEISYGSKPMRKGKDLFKPIHKFTIIRTLMVVRPHEKELKDF